MSNINLNKENCVSGQIKATTALIWPENTTVLSKVFIYFATSPSLISNLDSKVLLVLSNSLIWLNIREN